MNIPKLSAAVDLSGVAMLGVMAAGSALASDDMDPASINWGGILTQQVYVKASDNKITLFNNYYYFANDELIGSHASLEGATSEDDYLDHFHFQYEWGDSGVPSASEANAYWDVRFGEATRIQSAYIKSSACAGYALNTCATATGEYNYVLTLGSARDVFSATWGDVSKEARDAVQNGDILGRIEWAHFASVMNTRSNGSGGQEPDEIRWKWSQSGIYKYNQTNSNEYNFGLCDGWDGVGDVITELDWTWESDHLTEGFIYR
jgi:hypothetical protein